jgi:uncharacterized Zn-binding protein involved in type VI secretion
LNVLIGFLPAWRGCPLGASAGIQAGNQAAQAAITSAEATTAAAVGPAVPAAYAAEQALKAAQLASMTASIMSAAGGADIHACTTPLPVPPHGPGVVIDGSATVQTNFLPQSRMGDTVIEAVGPPNKVMKGEMTVIVGG